MGATTACTCGAAWSEYVHDLIESLKKKAEEVRCCFAGVAQACPIHEKRG